MISMPKLHFHYKFSDTLDYKYCILLCFHYRPTLNIPMYSLRGTSMTLTAVILNGVGLFMIKQVHSPLAK